MRCAHSETGADSLRLSSNLKDATRGPKQFDGARNLPREEDIMKTKFLKLVPILLASAVSAAVFAHGDDPKAKVKGEKLGRVLFKTSCTPEAQKQFERALAMLHSFHFPETIKAFTAVPETDSSCAIAYWGIAVSTRPNPLVGPWDAATLK